MLEQVPELFYPDHPTLVDALRWWSDRSPDHPAVTFLADGDNETARLTFADLDREAQRVAASLQQFTDPGDRALLCFPPGLDFVTAYLGSLYARVIAVPVYAPRKNRHLDRLAAIAADSGAVVALTNGKTAHNLQGEETRQLLSLPLFAVDDSGPNETATWRPPEIAADDIAFLQYTSGSTGTPRGVMVTHQNLATNIRMMGHSLGSHVGTRIVSWLPAFHDMGLIGTVLMPIWQGLSTVLMPPAAFVQEPSRWLRAISKYCATLAIGPNFGYELCCRHAGAGDISGLDLSSWEVACNGAEPIRPETLERFCSLFGPAGFRRTAFFPCYGLAEATVYASGRHLGRDRGIQVDRASLELGRITVAASEAGSQELVSCGYPPIGEQVAIVDPDTMRESAPGEVGEIWLAGGHVARGYWQNADATAATFGATIPTRGAATFLRTGDLGFLHEDELFVAGRLTDLIIIYGRNFYPQDIESTVDAHPAIRGSVSFSLSRDALEGVGVVAEVALNHLRGDLAPIAEAIAAAVWEEHEASVAQIALLKPAGLPRTSSGKLRRSHARDLLLRNELAEVFRWPPPPAHGEDTESTEDRVPGALPLTRRLLSEPVPDRHRVLMDLVTKEIGALLGRSPDTVLPDRPLSELGLDSVMALELRSRLAAATGLRLRSTLLFDYPTALAIARHLRTLLGLGDEDVAAAPGAPVLPDHDPIAIVSMSCRFPGGVTTPEELWQLLLDERDAISEFPKDRGWAAESGSLAGGVLTGADQFDPAFFGISPREAIAIDPQQRLLLETSWEALERAGIRPATLHGSSCGVYVGIFGNDYGAQARNAGAGPADLKGYLSTGSLPSVASGRIAYALGLEGPAISVDTACSSSLVAVHLACQALRQGECSLALAGGATVMATPAVFSELGPESAGAADGRSKAFSAEADGAGWSEGVGVVLLERLSDAQRNDHPVLAIVRGSAVNQDGRSQGLTAPNGPSQERVIRQALASARLSTSDVDVIEAHGTGTALGDPIEAQALLNTYGAGRAPARPVWLGSLKSNLGHTQAAAGVGGLIKMVLALQHRILPKTLHAQNASPLIDWSAGTVLLLNEAVPWARNAGPRRAAVSSFGLSGTNAHLILEEAPAGRESHPAASAEPPPSALPVLLSGRGGRAIRAQAEKLHGYLAEHSEVRLPDLAYSLATTRSHFEHRAVLVTHDALELCGELRAVASGQPAPSTVFGRNDVAGKVVFVFPGQGSEWAGMALSLLESSPVFRDRLEACERALAPYVDWSLLDTLRGKEGSPALDGVDVVQPVLFAVMFALAAVWRSMGVEPDAVVGHSQGEIAAACVAGALPLEDAARLVALRSRALRRLAGQGAMAVVGLAEGELQKRIERFGRRLSIAAVNGPDSAVVSGEVGDLDTLVRELSDAQVLARKLPIEIASHCAQIDAIEDELRHSLAGLEPKEAAVPFYSALTGALVDTTGLDADYWYRNIRQPVRFKAASESLLSNGHRFFVEVSPHPTLVAPLFETLEAAGVPAVVVGSLRRERDGRRSLTESLGALHGRGLGIDWTAFFKDLHPDRVDLPTYAFSRDRFWLEAPGQGAAIAPAGLMPADHPLLGAAVELADSGGLVLTGRISLSQHPWLADHAVYGRVILPGSAFVELALAAAQRTGLDRVEELTLEAALPLPAEGGVALQLTVSAPDETGSRPMALHARSDDGMPGSPWTRHASGTLSAAPPPARFDLSAWPPAGAVEIPLDGLYERLSGAGLVYSHAFRGLRAAWRRADEIFAEVQLPEATAADADRFGLHPALLDCVLHAGALDVARGKGQLRLPFSWRGVSLSAVGATALRARLRRLPGRGVIEIQLADSVGEPVGVVEALVTRPVAAGRFRDQLAVRDRQSLMQVTWIEPQAGPRCTSVAHAAVVGMSDLGPAFSSVAARLDRYADLAAMVHALDRGSAPPVLAVISCIGQIRQERAADLAAAAHATLARGLELLQAWLADDRLACCRLVLLTRRAVATGPDEDVRDLSHAPLWGLVRSAQAEYRDRAICLIDTDDSDASRRALATAVLSAQAQVALREGHQLAPALNWVRAPDTLEVPDSAAWGLEIPVRGTLESLTLATHPGAATPLADGQVRVEVRAAGLNFRDVLDALGAYPGEAGSLGAEGAGVVVEVGPGVTQLAVGDQVMGLFPAAFGPVVIADQRLLVRMPAGWSFAAASGVSVAFVTAYYCLVDLAHLERGERVLVHAAAGGVGMAAIQLARHLGAEVFATASPGKWEVLRSLGFDDAHLASSRTLDFEQHFLRSTDGRGMDVVLNSLAPEFADASLRLLSSGGRLIEMGKTGVRDPAQVAADQPAVAYRAFDLGAAEAGRTGQILAELAVLFERGAIQLLPTAPYDIRLAPRAFRVLARAQHVGKLVLTLPRRLRPDGTVLVTGGTGTLGGLVARRLVQEHGVRHLLLASRHGPAAAGAHVLRQELEAAGAHVVIAACDVSDRAAVEALLATIPSAHPLTAVVHAAGVLDDGALAALTSQRLDSVLRAKADAAWHLHELTQGQDLAAFIVFSSVAGVLGAPGQANYAAASSFLDALAHHRRSRGMHALALDWGLWAQETGLTAQLDNAARKRMARGGVRAITTDEGLALFDAALRMPHPALIAARFDLLPRGHATQAPHPMLGGLTRVRASRRAAGAPRSTTLKQRLLSLSPGDAEPAVLEVVQAEAAVVLGHASPGAIDANQSLESLGLDSLMAVELRSRLSRVAEIAFPMQSIRERNTVADLARTILEKMLIQMTAPGSGSREVLAESGGQVYQQEIL